MSPRHNPLQTLKPILDSLRDRYGPYIISPPAGRNAPVAILLPTDIRYCFECTEFKPREQMRYDDICAACAGQPRPKKKKTTRRAPRANGMDY
jgi:hypothetical protein